LYSTGAAQTSTISDAARSAIDHQVEIIQVRIESTTPGPSGGAASVSFQVKNVSRKTIYAVGYSVAVRYADGSTQSSNGRMLDLLPLYFERMYFEQGLDPRAPRSTLPALLHPAETFTEVGMATSFPP
jgi:hypothetical protein